MNYKFLIFLLIVAVGASAQHRLDAKLGQTIAYASEKYTIVLGQDPPAQGLYPHTGKESSTYWDDTTDFNGWTAGFYPGVLWQLYRLTLDTKWSTAAERAQQGIRRRENDTTTHDLGFVIMSSFGLGLNSGFGRENGWEDTIVQAAHTLCTRFVRNAGIIRSWNWGDPEEVTVIIDNMMNLDLLFTAAKISGNQTFVDIALSHSDKTFLHHFRPDASTYHVVAYNENDGHVMRRYQAQGYLDWSTWSRGQAWAIVGFLETAEWTKSLKYYDMARRAADIFIDRLPEDKIPFWDFDAGLEKGYQPRDTSAASIAAYGFLRMYLLTENEKYLRASEDIIESLLDNFSTRNVSIPAISINGTVHFKEGRYDTAIIYGDFYLLKYIELYLFSLA